MHPDDVEKLAHFMADLGDSAGFDEAVPEVEGDAGLLERRDGREECGDAAGAGPMLELEDLRADALASVHGGEKMGNFGGSGKGGQAMVGSEQAEADRPTTGVAGGQRGVAADGLNEQVEEAVGDRAVGEGREAGGHAMIEQVDDRLAIGRRDRVQLYVRPDNLPHGQEATLTAPRARKTKSTPKGSRTPVSRMRT